MVPIESDSLRDFDCDLGAFAAAFFADMCFTLWLPGDHSTRAPKEKSLAGLFQHGYVAHFTPRPGFRLAVGMDECARFTLVFRDGFNVVADQVEHFGGLTNGIKGGQAADRAHMLLELRDVAGINREVAGIVRARRDFVRKNLPVLRDKHLQCYNAAQVDLLR